MNSSTVLFLLTSIGVTTLTPYDSRDPRPPPATFTVGALVRRLLRRHFPKRLHRHRLSHRPDQPQRQRRADCLHPLPPRHPPVVNGFAFRLVLSKIGVIDGFARLLCGRVIISVPYKIRATLVALGGIDRTCTEPAMILGATKRRAV